MRSRLWRVHFQQYNATAFNPWPADDNFGGGRFDGTDRDPYPYFYAGLEAGTALAETLLRSIPYDEKGDRKIPRSSVRGRRTSVVETTQELTLVDLCSAEALAAVAQDTWLIQADPSDYHATRRWASWIRQQAPAAHGLIWPSRRLYARPALVLFEDRCPDGCLVADPAAGRDLDDLEGALWVNRFLAPYRASVSKPRRRTTK
ncbi:RES family NAD+ phosphorylase [Nonomuraea lactucae]|uniref:RES family NAD+ phosphorylase n=1 Tax=Nonomuraea lactucae TaxID=2249762 RepID=UPI001965B70B|nr:RES family NAD+ phosphorylase [Nonomuraea lactucae]